MAPGSTDRARVRATAGALRRLFGRRPAGLLTDIDGTISRITARNDDATVSPTARRALAQLADHLDLVAVVTGRSVQRAREMVGVPTIGYVGNHGLEWLQGGVLHQHPAGRAARPTFDAALAAIRVALPDPGVVLEDKGVSVAVHYRLAAQPEEAGRRILALLAPYVEAGALRVIEGGFVANLLPAVPVDKGQAVRRLVDEHGLASVAFFGDDITDLDGFRALHALRAAGRLDALTVGVASAEGPPELRTEADLVLEGVGEVERVLTALAAHPPGEA